MARSTPARIVLAVALLAQMAVAPGVANATTATTATTDPDTPVLVRTQHNRPHGFRMTAAQVRQIALRDSRVQAELRRHHKLAVYEYTKGPGRWQVSWFQRGRNQKELMQVYIDDQSGQVTEVWTGFQVAWTMARGYPGAFGRRVTALYVWIPLCVLFVVPFIPWRRRPSLLHLDLAVLLAFSISLAFFNHARIGLSVPLAYPPLTYLLVRMLLLAFGRGRPREPLRLLVPASWLAVAVVFLIGFRVGLNVANSNVIDVGYAGVIGADKLVHGKPLYGGWPKDNSSGDTYGPVNYMLYVPFRAVLGWSGQWDELPAAHGAAIAFDLLTLLGLFLLGRRIRGPTTGIVLAYAWASYPFTIYALSSNSNDSAVAMLVVLALLLIRSADWRGIAAALAALTKFAPLALVPLLARGTEDRPSRRSVGLYVLAFALTVLAAMLPVLLSGDLHAFWRDTISYQSGRGSPFSIWGLWGIPGPQRLFQGTVVVLVLAVALVPERRTQLEVAALAAAVLIALQLVITHWFYLYIPWFFAPLMAALLCSHPSRGKPASPQEPARAPELSPVPASAH